MRGKENKPFQLSFNGRWKVDFRGSRVTSGGGLILMRELDERLGLGQLIDEHLTDSRQGANKKVPLADLPRQSVSSRLAGSDRVVLDMDSTESPVDGQQEGSVYNSHFESVCCHLLVLFNSRGDCLATKLCPGNMCSAEDWDELLLPEIEFRTTVQNGGRHDFP